jgi:AraC family transcriptional regulator
MVIFIKNMVCNRCILIVRQELGKLGMEATEIGLGEVSLVKKPSKARIGVLKKRLHELGFELIEDEKRRIIEKVKTTIIEKIREGNIGEHFSIGKFIAKSFQKDDGSIGRLFSGVESITIEQYFILQKIEKVKEWLAYDELTLSEIAWKLGYSSVAHCSAQFKKVTGLTPTHFKSLGHKRRIPLDRI